MVYVISETNSGVCPVATRSENRAIVLGSVDWTSERSKKEYHQWMKIVYFRDTVT